MRENCVNYIYLNQFYTYSHTTIFDVVLRSFFEEKDVETLLFIIIKTCIFCPQTKFVLPQLLMFEKTYFYGNSSHPLFGEITFTIWHNTMFAKYCLFTICRIYNFKFLFVLFNIQNKSFVCFHFSININSFSNKQYLLF